MLSIYHRILLLLLTGILQKTGCLDENVLKHTHTHVLEIANMRLMMLILTRTRYSVCHGGGKWENTRNHRGKFKIYIMMMEGSTKEACRF